MSRESAHAARSAPSRGLPHRARAPARDRRGEARLWRAPALGLDRPHGAGGGDRGHLRRDARDRPRARAPDLRPGARAAPPTGGGGLISLLHPGSEETALIEAGGGAWTHAELAGAVGERAQAMSGRKSLVFVRCSMDARSVIDYLAALEAGHAAAMVDADLPPELLADLAERYSPALILGPDGASEHRSDLDPH